MTLTLQEILIVGSACEQAKFSELTMDMFRMLQTLEREPNEANHAMMSMAMGMHGQLASIGPHDSSPATKLPYSEQCSKGFLENGEKRPYRDNPHKYLLYKPSISQLLVFLASGFKELPPGGALLLYISADGCFSTTQHPEDCKCFPAGDSLERSPGVNCDLIFLSWQSIDGYELGGLGTSVKRDGMDSGISCRGKNSGYKEPHCFYPGDLYPFTRRPLFIIIDSDNSFVFQHVPR